MNKTLQETLLGIRERGAYVLVVGMGISGVETAQFLLHIGVKPLCVERQTEAVFRQASKFVAKAEEIRRRGGRIEFGFDGEKIAPLLENVELAVLSPGVPLESAVVGTIQRCRIPWVSELELGVQLHGGQSAVITGSNGKSTTTSLLYSMLEKQGMPAFLCGNVGVPVISSRELLSSDPLVGRTSQTTLVVEASSYQLEACEFLKPKVSMVLNLSENHLERHGTMQRYGAAKFRVMRLQDESDLAILNADDPLVRVVAATCRAKVAFFTSRPINDLPSHVFAWARVDHANGLVEVFDSENTFSVRTDATKLLGGHNRYNIAAAALAARFLGVSADVIQQTVNEFEPLEHRVELLRTVSGAIVINDSKSTTVAASLAAASTVRDAFPGKRILLLLGGLSKAGSWAPLLEYVRSHQASFYPVLCFGKDGPLLASHCEAASIPFSISAKLAEAVRDARAIVSNGDVVLLSPGCASFDEFKDFEHRGREFKNMVQMAFADGSASTVRTSAA